MRILIVRGVLARGVLALGVLALAPVIDARPSAAQGAWCAYYNGHGGGGTNCGFYTLQQCRASVSGVGGTCGPDPWSWYQPNPYEPQPKRLKRHHRHS